MKTLAKQIAILLFFTLSLDAFADTVKPIINNSRADKTNSCWVVEVQLQSIFADVTTATDDSSSMGNGLILKADPASPQGGAAVDTRFQGTTRVTYTAIDPSGNMSTQCINYVVRDIRVGPFGFYGEEDTIIVGVNTPFKSTMKFRDSFDGELTDSILIISDVFELQLGSYSAKYSVTNSRGQLFEKTTIVRVLDFERPVIYGKNGSVMKILVNSDYDPIDYINPTDNYDAPSTLRDSLVILSNDLDLTTPGVYSTAFQTKDRSNNLSNIFTLITDVRLTLSTTDLEERLFANVYPNPANDVLYIESPKKLVASDITILGVLGSKVNHTVNETLKGYILDVSSLAEGIYFVKIRSGKKLQWEKILIN